MNQYTETNTTLEMRRKVGEDTWQVWAPPLAEMYRPAMSLAYQGRITEALELAERIQIQNYGNASFVEFRCVTKTTTITAISPLNQEWANIR
jgi:hypothetical protein